MPITVGIIHTYVHFSDLLSPEIQDYLEKDFYYSGKEQPLWDAWGIANFMMGISFLVIGLLNIYIYRSLSKTDFPPLPAIFAMLVYILGVIFVGVQFQQSFQLYGGITGLILLSISLFLTLRKSTKST